MRENTCLHLQRHGNEYVLLPSIAGIEHDLPSAVVDDEYVLLHVVVDRHVLLSASVDDGHSLLTVIIGNEYVLEPVEVAGGCALLSALAGCSSVYL